MSNPPVAELRRSLTLETLAAYFDHTLLRADATPEEIKKFCLEAARHRFFSVCVNSAYVKLATETLASTRAKSNVKTVAVVGFPLGAMATEAKAFETSHAVRSGASEIDVVLHLGLLKAGLETQATEDLRSVVQAANGAPVKVILETALLASEEAKVQACRIAVAAGAAFVKTSTGFGPGGATEADVALLRRSVPASVGVKASGGIRTLEQALTLIAAGANRIGASTGVAILDEFKGKSARNPRLDPDEGAY